MKKPNRLYDAYILDLDGTVYLGDALLPAAGETITTLRNLGKKTVFLSNNPTRTRTEYAHKLTRLGLATPPEDVVNSSYVMISFLKRELDNGRLFVVGEASLCHELQAAGFSLTDDPSQIDAVIASFDRTFDYRKLQIAFDAIQAGARFFATNADRFCPIPGGGQPDAAAMIAAIEACTNSKVEAVVGKPSRFMADTILDILQREPDHCLMIGDRLETDIKMGLDAGMATALTLTGATDELSGQNSTISPTFIINTLSELLP